MSIRRVEIADEVKKSMEAFVSRERDGACHIGVPWSTRQSVSMKTVWKKCMRGERRVQHDGLNAHRKRTTLTVWGKKPRRIKSPGRQAQLCG
jgi:hypothetical protein